MKRIGSIVVLLLASQLACAQWAEGNGEQLVIRGGWLFDGVSNERRPNTGIVIRNGKIVEVDADVQQQVLSDARVVDLAETDTLLPGMIDLHAHYNLDLVDEGRVEEVVYNGIVFLANGVTSTWSAGEYYPERVIAQRDRVDAGESIGPRLFASGPYFGAFRCEYNVKVSADECIGWPNDITEEEIRREVDAWAEQGVISIKIKQATPGEMMVLIEQAHKNGMTAAAHLANYNVEYDVDLRDAILMGLDRVEHQLTLGSGGPGSAELPQMIDLMLAHDVYYDANLQMYGGINERRAHQSDMVWTDEAKYFTPYAQALLEKRGPPPPESDAEEFAQRVFELKALFDAGGGHLLVVGTDEPVYTNLLPGFAYHRELLAMTYAGLPPAAVLKAATINGAKALGIDDRLGSIEAGKLADLYVVRGDPLDDIKAARDIRFVFKDGIAYDPEELLQAAEGKIGPAGPDDHADWELELRPLREDP
ncbi:MAG: amidohydrolase family protein [Gammaproteobacteria bacterium]|nr:amidohydrolase family protein [Gammaproteobacteria bacterium]